MGAKENWALKKVGLDQESRDGYKKDAEERGAKRKGALSENKDAADKADRAASSGKVETKK
ncbi:hypothetical protein [Candidatus Trichorickettsia mobilis]|uniref:hypothetical protein n=1 Tax=Candidatus Trichorickettsia mobilis TaxID=1346319 RepID=UPI003742E7B7